MELRYHSSSYNRTANSTMIKALVLAVVIGTALAAELPSSGYPKPAAGYAKEPLMPYNFNWAVRDDPSYNSFAQSETSDGKVVSGEYRVALPDGRTQIVTYTVDEHSGFVPNVRYEGEAKYPEYKAQQAAYAKPASKYP